MEWYAQVGWTVIISILTIYYIVTKIIFNNNNNSPNNNEQQQQEETYEKFDENIDQTSNIDDTHEELFKCEVEEKNVEIMKAIILSKRSEDVDDKWQLTKVRKITELNSENKVVEVSCVICAGDKCQMINKIVLNDLTILSKEEYNNADNDGSTTTTSSNVKSEKKEEKNDSITTTTPIKNNNTMPLWPDKATPVRFGGYGKSNKIVWKSPEKKKTSNNQAKSSAKKQSQVATNEIPVGVIPIKSLSEYQDILAKAGSKYPVIIDFYADWCGPCKRMKPIFDQMALSFNGRAYFCNVNTDEVKAVSNMMQIRSLPTFLVIKDGRTVEKILGANVEALREAIMKHVIRTTGKKSSSKSRLSTRSGSAYGVDTFDVNEQYLPCIATTQAIYMSKKNLNNILEKIIEFNELLKSTTMCIDAALLPKEVVELKQMVQILQAGNMWHSNLLTTFQINLIVHMLTKWPTHFCFPALDLCRIALLHPSIETYMLDESGEKLCVAILEHAERSILSTATTTAETLKSDNDIDDNNDTSAVTTTTDELNAIADRNSTIALRCCVNLFKFRSIWKISLSNMENIINICVNSNFQACSSNRKLLEAVAAVIFNCSMVAFAYPKECKNTIKSKIILFSTLLIAVEINSKPGPNSTTVIRNLLQTVGTIIYSCRKDPDFLSAGTRRNLALTTASISSYGVLNEIRAMHKILELIPKTKQVVENFPNPWAGE